MASKKSKNPLSKKECKKIITELNNLLKAINNIDIICAGYSFLTWQQMDEISNIIEDIFGAAGKLPSKIKPYLRNASKKDMRTFTLVKNVLELTPKEIDDWVESQL